MDVQVETHRPDWLGRGFISGAKSGLAFSKEKGVESVERKFKDHL